MLIVLLDQTVPITQVIAPPVSYSGALLIAVGLGLGFSAVTRFRRAETGIVPGSEATVLVRSGPFRFTRNPMYLGMTLMLLGLAIVLGSLSPFTIPLLFLVLMDRVFVRKEERWMEEAFGDEYLVFKRGTRRWL
jgi:protein-S-isoprenylcysteine O-methyltransferase Ste14